MLTKKDLLAIGEVVDSKLNSQLDRRFKEFKLELIPEISNLIDVRIENLAIMIQGEFSAINTRLAYIEEHFNDGDSEIEEAQKGW